MPSIPITTRAQIITLKALAYMNKEICSKLYLSLTHQALDQIYARAIVWGFDPEKPTNHDVEWTGDKWALCKRSDFGGYADRYPRLSAFVLTLKAGRHAK